MNANFSPCYSRSSCYLAPTPPRRKRSNDLERILRFSSVPAHLQLASSCNDEPSCVDPRNTIFCNDSTNVPRRGRLQREKRMSNVSVVKASSMMFDQASRQRAATTKSIVIPRANSCDMKPSLPTRKATPTRERPSSNSFAWNPASTVHNTGSFYRDEEKSAAIRKPDIKTNIFLQKMSSPTNSVKQGNSSPLSAPLPKYEHSTPPTNHVKTFYTRGSPNSVLDERRPSATARKEHLLSRWESSPSLSSAPSCFMGCFSDETRLEPRKQRGMNRNISSYRLEAIMM